MSDPSNQFTSQNHLFLDEDPKEQSKPRLISQQTQPAFCVSPLTSIQDANLGVQAVVDLPRTGEDSGLRFGNMTSVYDQVPCQVLANTSINAKPGPAQRQDSGYFDMVSDDNRKSDHELQEVEHGQDRTGSYFSEDTSSFFGGQRNESIDYGNSNMTRGVIQDVKFYLSKDVSLDKNSKSNETPLYSQCNAQPSYYAVSNEQTANSKTFKELSWEHLVRCMSSLSKIPNAVSKFPSLFMGTRSNCNFGPSKHEATSNLDTHKKQPHNTLYVPQRCSENPENDNSNDIQLQMSKLWCVVKALCLAVFLLTVAIMVLFYKVHNLECPGIDARVYSGGPVRRYGDHWLEEDTRRISPDDFSTDNGATDEKSLPLEGGTSVIASSRRDFRPFDPEKDGLFWLENDVTAKLAWSPESSDRPQSQDGTVSQHDHKLAVSQLGFAKETSDLASVFQNFPTQLDENSGNINDIPAEIDPSYEDNHYDEDNDDDYNDDDDDDDDDDGDSDKNSDNGLLHKIIDTKETREGLSEGEKDVQRDLELSPHKNWTTYTKSSERGAEHYASWESLTPTLPTGLVHNSLIRKVRSVTPKPTAKPKRRGKRGWKGKGKKTNKNWNKNKKWNKGTKKNGERKQCGKITSETYEGKFGDHFVMRKHFIPNPCITVRRWPKQPKVCRDEIIRFEHAGTPLGFFSASKQNENSKWKKLVDFHIQTGKFRVLKPGVYFLQVHLYFEDPSKSHWLAIFHNQKAVLACPPGGFRSSTNAKGKDNQRVCQASGIIQLQSNNTLEIRTMEPDMEVVLKAEKMATFKIVRIRPTK